jgi:hypothetical protein
LLLRFRSIRTCRELRTWCRFWGKPKRGPDLAAADSGATGDTHTHVTGSAVDAKATRHHDNSKPTTTNNMGPRNTTSHHNLLPTRTTKLPNEGNMANSREQGVMRAAKRDRYSSMLHQQGYIDERQQWRCMTAAAATRTTWLPPCPRNTD